MPHNAHAGVLVQVRIVLNNVVEFAKCTAPPSAPHDVCFLLEQLAEELVWELFIQAGPLGKWLGTNSALVTCVLSVRSAALDTFGLTTVTYWRSECVPAKGPRHQPTPGLRVCGVPIRG